MEDKKDRIAVDAVRTPYGSKGSSRVAEAGRLAEGSAGGRLLTTGGVSVWVGSVVGVSVGLGVGIVVGTHVEVGCADGVGVALAVGREDGACVALRLDVGTTRVCLGLGRDG